MGVWENGEWCQRHRKGARRVAAKRKIFAEALSLLKSISDQHSESGAEDHAWDLHPQQAVSLTEDGCLCTMRGASEDSKTSE